MSSPTSTPPASRESSYAIADRLHAAAIRLLRRLRKEDEKTGLSAARASALSVLVFAGPLSLGELAAAEQVRPPTMSRVVAGLVADGLANRVANPEDRRAIRVSATRKGHHLLQHGRQLRLRSLLSMMSGLSLPELEVLDTAVSLLERIVRT
jgi:DNA-binding MarR family transcriptional regulator